MVPGRAAALAVLLTLTPLAAPGPGVLAGPLPGLPTCPEVAEALAAHRPLVARPPIRITGPLELTPAHGVAAGLGTAECPFLVSGWRINGTFWRSAPVAGPQLGALLPGAGIEVRNTEAHVWVHRNLLLDNPDAGVWVEGAANVTVVANEVRGSPVGVAVLAAQALARGNLVAATGTGLRLEGAGAIAEANTVQAGATGIVLRDGAAARGNAVEAEQGLLLEGAARAEANDVRASACGAVLRGPEPRLERNTLRGGACGVAVEGASGAAVIGNRMLGPGAALRAHDAPGLRVEGNVVRDAADGLRAVRAPGVRLEGNDVARVGSGLLAGSAGVGVEQSPGAALVGNAVADVRGSGVVARESPRARVEANRVAWPQQGLWVGGSPGAVVLDNVVEGLPRLDADSRLSAPPLGARIEASDGVLLARNRVERFVTGIMVLRLADATLLENEVHGHLGFGLPVVLAQRVLLARNNASGNHDGIMLAVVEDSQAVENVASNNVMTGMTVAAASKRNLVARNTFAGNYWGAFFDFAFDSLVVNNTIRRNVLTGLDFRNHAEGNLARGNNITDNAFVGVLLFRNATRNLVEWNDIAGNGDSGLVAVNAPWNDARRNWWGSPEGPGAAQAVFVKNSFVELDPWLPAPVEALNTPAHWVAGPAWDPALSDVTHETIEDLKGA